MEKLIFCGFHLKSYLWLNSLVIFSGALIIFEYYKIYDNLLLFSINYM